MTRPLEGRVAVVTGGSRGIGRGIALRLARDGAHCALTYRQNDAAAAETVTALEALGVRAVAERLDLADPEQVGPAVERIAAVFGRVGGVVGNSAAPALRP
ncbi:MAG: SDR family NAD(P)-dependent oxidoreductase, partial [Candidatus Rokuibacteriota bacterium]